LIWLKKDQQLAASLITLSRRTGIVLFAEVKRPGNTYSTGPFSVSERY
jgi:hypothetical protein